MGGMITCKQEHSSGDVMLSTTQLAYCVVTCVPAWNSAHSVYGALCTDVLHVVHHYILCVVLQYIHMYCTSVYQIKPVRKRTRYIAIVQCKPRLLIVVDLIYMYFTLLCLYSVQSEAGLYKCTALYMYAGMCYIYVYTCICMSQEYPVTLQVCPNCVTRIS